MLYEQVDIYLDESGDLGFTFPGSSNHLILCAMATTDGVALSRVPKKCRQRYLSLKGMNTEIKFSKSNDDIRAFFLNKVAESNSWIVWGAIDKHNVKEPLRKKKDKLYHYVCGMVLSDIFSRTHARKINVVLDRMTAKKTNRNDFDRYIEEKMFEKHAGNFEPELTVSHLVSQNCQCLQVHDFVVGSIFQSVERENQQYASIISDKIVSGRKYW